MALLEAIADRHDEAPGVISSAAALDTYTDADALTFDPRGRNRRGRTRRPGEMVRERPRE